MPTCLLHISQYLLHLACLAVAQSVGSGKYPPCAHWLLASAMIVYEWLPQRSLSSLVTFLDVVGNSASAEGVIYLLCTRLLMLVRCWALGRMGKAPGFSALKSFWQTTALRFRLRGEF